MYNVQWWPKVWKHFKNFKIKFTLPQGLIGDSHKSLGSGERLSCDRSYAKYEAFLFNRMGVAAIFIKNL